MPTTLPLADHWFDVERIGNEISLIREKHVASWLRCNIWHVQGRDRDLVIDTGMGVSPLKAEIGALCAKPVVCVSSHAHFDHIGGAHEFDCRLGHRDEEDIHRCPDQHNSGNWGPFVRAETFTALPRQGFRYQDYRVEPAPLTGYLDEGDVIDLGNRQFQILHLPGHSPGSIALFESDTATLFSGDTVYDGALYDTVYHSDREKYRASLERLRELPVEVVHGGHFESFGHQRMLQLIDGYLAGDNVIEDPDSWIRKQL